MHKKQFLLVSFAALAIAGCKHEDDTDNNVSVTPAPQVVSAIATAFGDNINLEKLEQYANQTRPAYITKDNSGSTPITDAGATLGRVLFYDKNLSVSNAISCASCHKQDLAFGDDAVQSQGANGLSNRHAMRLVNSRFSQEMKFFWDERAASLELQTTMPVQDHKEMGYSGQNGDPGLADLITKLKTIDYYKELFTFVYGDADITEARMQSALSQFIRSIQSFDSKFDAGLAAAGNINANFPNFTQQENMGKRLFTAPPAPPQPGVMRGAGCQGCHRAPEFDIDPASRNNGVTGVAGSPGSIDVSNTRAGSIRNIVNMNGALNGPLMHDGSINSLDALIEHYNVIIRAPGNNNLDPRLTPGGQPQNLQLSTQEKEALIAFLKTLSGPDVYTNKKWSDPFLTNK